MRIPKVYNYKDQSKVVNLELEKPIIIPRLPVISNDKQRDKLIKTIEKYIRSSDEYRDYIKFLRDNLDMNYCHYFNNINGKKKRGFIEIHHEPFSLYDLTNIVMTKHEQTKGYIDELDVAEEVMYIHYSNRVGLIPVSITPHELIHTGKIIVPLDCTYGNFIKFVEDYLEYMDPGLVDMLEEKIELTKKLSRQDLSILNVRYIYTTIEGFDLPQIVEDKISEK